MKKRWGVRRAVPIVAASRLEAMNTKQLLARLARLRFCEDRQEAYVVWKHVYILDFIRDALAPYYQMMRFLTFPELGPL